MGVTDATQSTDTKRDTLPGNKGTLNVILHGLFIIAVKDDITVYIPNMGTDHVTGQEAGSLKQHWPRAITPLKERRGSPGNPANTLSMCKRTSFLRRACHGCKLLRSCYAHSISHLPVPFARWPGFRFPMTGWVAIPETRSLRIPVSPAP